jgi:predicted ester cyclase
MPQQNQTTELNKQVVQRFVEEFWNQGILNKVSELLADQVRFHDPVFPNLNPGIQNIKNHIEGCRKAFPDLKFTIDDTIAERNEVVLHRRVSGTHKGQFLGMQPTQRKVTVDGTSIYRLDGFEDRRIPRELESRDDDGATRRHRGTEISNERCKTRVEVESGITSQIGPSAISISVNFGGRYVDFGTPT